MWFSDISHCWNHFSRYSKAIAALVSCHVVCGQPEARGKHVGRIRLLRVPNASAVSLTFAVKEMIEPGSIVNTDGWAGYASVGAKGYVHEQTRPLAEVGDNLLPLAHRVASLLKRWLGGTHQGAVRPSHLDYYLDEFTFRFNRRTSRSRGKLFYRLMQQATQVGAVTGDDIRGGKGDNNL